MTAPYFPPYVGNSVADVLQAQQEPGMGYAGPLNAMSGQLGNFGHAALQQVLALLQAAHGPANLANPLLGMVGTGEMGAPRPKFRGFHGTDAEFSGFRDGPTWFSSNRDDIFVKTRKNVKEAELDLANPLTPKTARERIGDIQAAFMQSGVPEQEGAEVLRYIQNNDPSAFFYVSPAMQKAYESLGFDGAHVNEGLKSGDWYVTFKGEQAQQVPPR
jgi:hypothetical protein